MPYTQPTDYSQYFDPAYLRSLGSYTGAPSTPSAYAGNVGNIGGSTPANNNVLGIPGGGLIQNALPGLGSIFGSKPGWKPYLNDQGQYVYTDPNKRNPVPQATVPGAPLAPSKRYQSTAADVQGLTDLLPYLNQAINQGITPTAIANLQASQATSPAYAQMMTDLYNQYGPQLNAIGNQINLQNMLASQGAVNQTMNGPGAQTVTGAQQLQQQVDQPYYTARQQAGNRLGDLLNSIDLSGALSQNERDQLQKGLSRNSILAGNYGAPSQTNTLSNAMQYGNLGYQRQQEAKSNLSQALGQASNFMPAAKSGMDAFQIATGKSSMSNPGAGLFPGVNQNTGQSSNAQYGLAGSILGNMNALDTTQMNINANKKDWMDYISQGAGAIGSLTGSAKGLI